ncbi:MAG: TonB-dependent receptor [Sphingobacteriaceae bacterium]
MKLTVVLLVTTLLHASAAGYAQKITLSKSSASLEQVFWEISNQSGYEFVYDVEMLKEAKPVNAEFKNTSLEKVLKECFAGQPLTYTIQRNFIIVKRKQPSLSGVNQVIPITGKVTDENGNPLPGVTVKVKNSNLAVVTDTKGEFAFRDIDGDAILVFSYIGFITQEVAANNQSSLQISLKEDRQQLNELVIVGYGQQRKQDITAAVSSFKPTEENARPVLGPDQLIQGRMAGVNVSGGSGSPGSSNRVTIRGIGSLSATNEPLYVIDGVPLVNRNAALINLGENMNPLSLLNPNDIESVEVLKDAASSAIYGSRATNGVILITTKSGKAGKSKFGVDIYTGFSQVPKPDRMDMAMPDQYLAVVNEAIDNFNIQNNYDPGSSNYVLREENPFPGEPGTNWFDLVTRTAQTQSVSMSFTGGTDKTKVYLSGNYLGQEGAIIQQKFTKYTAKLNLLHKLYNWLEFGVNTNFSYSTNDRVPGSNSGATMMARSIPQRPFDRPYKPNGGYYLGGTDELIYHNPFQIINEQDAILDNYRFLGTFIGTAKLMEGLTFKTMLGTDLTYTLDNVYYNQNHPYGTGVGLKYDNRRFTPNTLWENTLNYNKQIDKLAIDALAGYSYQKVNFSSSEIEGRGFPTSSFQQLSVAAEINSAGTDITESALKSFFGRTNFSWDKKYLLSLSLRADGSSKFNPENRWGYFPSVSAGWNASNESFWTFEGTTAKLRASYGETGNQDGISSYAYQSQMSGGRNYNNQSGIGVSTNGNRNLTWETAQQFGVGVDLTFLNGKVNFTTDYFIKNTNNLLYSKPEPATTGFTSIISNVGSMRNKGWEFMLGTNFPIGPVTWTSDFNISFIKNKLTSLIGDEPLLIGANRTLQVGEEVGSFYMYKQLGIYQTDDEVPTTLYTNSGVRAGDVIYEDLDGNNKIDVNDRQIIGSSNPDFFGGWNNGFSYKNFDLNVFFTYSYGNDVYASYRITTERLGNGFQNMTQRVINERWTGPGTSNTTPRAISGSSWNTQNSSRFLEDGSYLRLRSLNLGYTLPQTIAKRIGMNRVRVYAQGDNLFLWTKYKGFDPEVTSDFDPQFIGQDNMILPQLRTINFGINIGI